jgi:ABC-2 type transport system permease protein
MDTLNAELKKLLTVRSTYILIGFFLLLTWGLSFYVHGFSEKGIILDLHFLDSTVTSVASTLSVAGALLGLLLMTHEYRHNTIMYTLTASNSRTRVLLSKIAAVFITVLVYSLVGALIALLCTRLGVAVAGHTLPAQDFNLVTYLAKIVFFCEGFAMAGLLFAALIRNQVGSLAALFVLPNTIEGLLSLILKHNSVYLPFTALGQVPVPPSMAGANIEHSSMGYLTPAKGALVFTCYIVIGWIIAWYLFQKRDAN